MEQSVCAVSTTGVPIEDVSLSLMPRTDDLGCGALVRARMETKKTMMAFERISKAMQRQVVELMKENATLRKELTRVGSQGREAVKLHRFESSSDQDRIQSLEETISIMKNECVRERELFHEQVESLKAELRRVNEGALFREQEMTQTISSLRQELQQARNKTMLHIAAFHTEKEAVFQELEERSVQRIAQARAEEHVLVAQDYEKRINLLEMKHKQELDEAVVKAFQDGKFALYSVLERRQRYCSSYEALL